MMKNWAILALIIGVWFYLALAQSTPEDLTIITYHPSPYGSYNELRWGCLNQGRSVARLVADEGGSIELGGFNCTGPIPGAITPRARPYIAFFDTNSTMASTIRSDINTLKFSGSDPNFQVRILGGLQVENWLDVNRTILNAEIRVKLGKGGCYERQVVSENEYLFAGREAYCNDGDYLAGLRVVRNFVESGDWDLYGIYIKCCVVQ